MTIDEAMRRWQSICPGRHWDTCTACSEHQTLSQCKHPEWPGNWHPDHYVLRGKTPRYEAPAWGREE